MENIHIYHVLYILFIIFIRSLIFCSLKSMSQNKLWLSGSWTAKYRNVYQWILVDLTSIKSVLKITTQGRIDDTFSQWVTSYLIHYSMNNIDWSVVQDENGSNKVFTANADLNGKVVNMMPCGFRARYIRVHPQTWYGHISMRIGLVGF